MYPNAEQRQVLARYFGSVRFIYNHYLAQRKEQYEQTGRSDNYSPQSKDLVTLKRTEGYEWLKEINSQTPTGKYYVSILTEEQYEPIPRTNASVGLDMGLKSLVITSEGETYDNNRYTKKYEHKLATAQEEVFWKHGRPYLK